MLIQKLESSLSLSCFSPIKSQCNISSEHATVGFFWLNAAEGWIDVLNDKLNTKVSKYVDDVEWYVKDTIIFSVGEWKLLSFFAEQLVWNTGNDQWSIVLYVYMQEEKFLVPCFIFSNQVLVIII